MYKQGFSRNFVYAFLQKCRRGSSILRRAFLRSGNWNNGDNAGPFTLNLNNAPSNTNNNIGFRCARFSDF